MRPSKTLSIAVTALSAAVVYLCSYIAIPLPFSPVPVTAHTLAITLVALILPRRESIGAILIYLLLGIVTGGVTFGPAVGYYAGFILTAVLLPTFRGSGAHIGRFLLLSVLAALWTDLCGAAGMMLVQGLAPGAAFVSGILVFLPGDLLKAAAASIAAVPIRRATARMFQRS